MPKSVEEYKDFLGYEFTGLMMSDGWDNLLDGMIDHEGIEYPDESEAGTVAYEVAEKIASDKYEVELGKAKKALVLYLEDCLSGVSGRPWSVKELSI